MKIDKEYPATHSMETNWFLCDVDGNVAAVEFCDDGPQPKDIPDTFPEDLIFSEFAEQGEGYLYLSLTDEQADDLIKLCKPFKLTEENEYYVWLIHAKESAVDNLLKIGEKPILLSREKGLILYNFLRPCSYTINQFVEDGTILDGCPTNIEWETRTEGGAPFDESYNNFINLPFFAYSQNQDYDGRLVLDYRPKHPFKKEQLSSALQSKLINVNLKFGDDWAIQLAEDLRLTSWGTNEKCTYYLGRYKYTRYKKTNGEYAFFPVFEDYIDFEYNDKNSVHVPDDYKDKLGGMIEFEDMKYLVENFSCLDFEDPPIEP